MDPLLNSQTCDEDTLKREVAELTDAIIHEEHSVIQRERLEQLVLTDDRAADYYLQYVEDSYRLHDVAQNLLFHVHEKEVVWHTELDFSDMAIATSGTPAPENQSTKNLKENSHVLGFLSESLHHVGKFIMKPTPFSVVFAMAVISIGVIALSQIYFQNQQVVVNAPQDNTHYSQNKVVADVIGDYQVVWAKQNQRLQRGDPIRKDQPIEIQSGLLEIQFNDGSIALLEGPANFKADSDDAATLTAGRLRATAKPGFTIDTPAVRITDLSTEFGVFVKDDEVCDVHVFQGQVQTDQFDKQGKLTTRRILSQGEALRFTKFTKYDSPQPKLLVADQTAFKRKITIGLITHYSFEGPIGSEDVALDGLVSDNLSFFEGARVVNDAGGQGKRPSKVLQLTSEKDYATAKGSSVDLKRPGSFTISLWAKFAKPMNQQGSFPAFVIKSGISPSGVYNYYCGMNGGTHDPAIPQDHLRFTFHDNGSPSDKQRLRFNWDGDSGRWHHYTYVFDHRAMKMHFYLDGNLKVTTFTDQSPVTNNFDVLVGRSPREAGNWNGWLDEIRIYKTALSDKRTMKLYREGLSETN